MTQARKDDNGKAAYAAVPTKALEELAHVMTFGMNKYGLFNFLSGSGLHYSQLFSAAMRHLLAFWHRIDTDPESGREHLAHCAACVMMLLEYRLRGKGVDDRYKE